MEQIHYLKSGNDLQSGESYLIDRQCREISRAIAEKCGYEPERVVLDGAETDAGRLAASLEGGGLFSSARLVLWKNPFQLKGVRRQSETGAEEILGVLEQFVQDAPPDCSLVVTNCTEKAPPYKKRPKKKKSRARGGGDEGGWLEQWLLQKARVHELQPLPPASLEAWIEAEMGARGLGRDRQAITDLVKSGQDMYYISTLLDKMVLVCGARTLHSEDLAYDLESRLEYSVFKFLDELRARDVVTALYTLGRLLEQGESPIGIVAMMAWDLKQLGRIKAFKDENLPAEEIASQTRLKAWQVNRHIRNAAHFTWGELENLNIRILEADIAMKNSSRNERLLLEALVMAYGKK